MRADRRNLQQVFEPTLRLVTPLFQRPYVWDEEENWEPLWASVKEVAESRVAGQVPSPSFLGAIVVDQLKVSLGNVDQRQIIDGQQRLATLQVLLAVIRDICGCAGADKLQKAFGKFTENDVPLCDDPDDIFKVWPTNFDQDHFRQTMKAGSREELLAGYGVSSHATSLPHRIPAAYLYFYRHVAKWLGTSSEPSFEERAKALWEALRQDVVLVAIDLEDRDDPQLIFETLNALGTPLLPADLVKNYLFHEASKKDDDNQYLYDTYWKPFDRDDGFWRKEVRQGRLNRPRLDLFLQHYLTLMTADEIGATHLFTAFRKFATNGQVKTVEEHFRLLRDYGRIYRSWHEYSTDTEEGMFFYRLEQLDTTTVYPLLLEVFMQMKSPDDRPQLLQILNDLESFLLRRIVCGLTTKNYNRLFLDLVQDLKKRGFTAVNVRDFLDRQEAESTRWPSDEEFEHNWRTKQIYYTVVRKRLRMILEALELECRDDWGEKIEIGQSLPVEHLMPVAWRDGWPLPTGLEEIQVQEARTRRDYVLHTIGNLTLITKKLNSSISNGPWKKKIKAIKEHSTLSLNAKLHDHAEWNEDKIAERADALFGHAKKIWWRPEGGPSFVPDPAAQQALTGEQCREIRLDYWTAFREAMGASDSPVRPPIPSEGTIATYPIGTSWFCLWSQVSIDRRRIVCGLVCSGNAGKDHFHMLERDKEEIQGGFDEQLLWEEMPEQKSSYISLYLDCDPTDRGSWADQHAWLRKNLTLFHQTFAERVAKLGKTGNSGDDAYALSRRVITDVLEEEGAYEVLASRNRNVWFLPTSWSAVVPENGTVWKHLNRPVSVACWFYIKEGKIGLIFELSRMESKDLRLACAKKLREVGFSLTKDAFSEDATYSRFYRKSRTDIDAADEDSIREAVSALLGEAMKQFPIAEGALREVFNLINHQPTETGRTEVRSSSKRYDDMPFLYWWDVWDERKQAIQDSGFLMLIQRDTRLKATVPAKKLLPALTEARRTSRGQNKGGKGNWGLYVRPHRMNEIEVAGGRGRRDTPVVIPVVWE